MPSSMDSQREVKSGGKKRHDETLAANKALGGAGPVDLHGAQGQREIDRNAEP